MKPNLTIDMGYCGEFDLTIKFTDQNCREHSATFNFEVAGEKPTVLTVSQRSETQILFRMTENEIQGRLKHDES